MAATPLNNGNNDNGKALASTLAKIDTKIDHIADDLRDFKSELRRIDNCTDDLEVESARLKTKMENLEGRVNSWSAMNSVAAAIAGVLAAVGLSR